jgi:hypothetical protein
VFVAGKYSNNVFKITPTGEILEIIGNEGDGAGNPLGFPSDLVVDRPGNVFVAGQNSDNVFKITPTDEIAEIVDARGNGTGNRLDFTSASGSILPSAEDLYGYVFNDPVNGVDLLGFSRCRKGPPNFSEEIGRWTVGVLTEVTAGAIEAGAVLLAVSGSVPGKVLAGPVALLGAGLGAIGGDLMPGVDAPIIDDGDPCECTP